MKSIEIVNVLEDAGFIHLERRHLLNRSGRQIILECGAIVNVFKTGKFSVQGKVTPRQKLYLEAILNRAFKSK